MPLITAIIIPLFAVVAYSDAGLSWGAIGDLALAEEMRAVQPHGKVGMANSVDKLAEKLKTQPENTQGWFLLAQSYLNMGEFKKSAEAFKFLTNQFPQDHTLASYYAESVYMAEGREMTERAANAVENALKLNPENITMLEIKAMTAFQKGNLQGALDYFQTALAARPDKERAELIDRAITRITEDLNARGIALKPLALEAKNGKTGETSGAGSRQLQVLVEVADNVDAGASMSVFVFARAVQGPPMPLAVERLVRGALPKLIVLDESMAMMQGMGLANFDKVQVVARISSSGIANVSPDDYQALSGTIDLTVENPVIKLKIEKQVKDF